MTAATEALGAWLRRLRCHAGLTVVDVADAAGLSDSTVAGIEHGRRSRPSTVAAVVRAIAAVDPDVGDPDQLAALAAGWPGAQWAEPSADPSIDAAREARRRRRAIPAAAVRARRDARVSRARYDAEVAAGGDPVTALERHLLRTGGVSPMAAAADLIDPPPTKETR